jgi:DNA transformation protein
MLAAAGIETVEQLRELGAVEAYARVCDVWKGASLNLLWALDGALSGEHWQVVARERRASLLLALDARREGIPSPPPRRRPSRRPLT